MERGGDFVFPVSVIIVELRLCLYWFVVVSTPRQEAQERSILIEQVQEIKILVKYKFNTK